MANDEKALPSFFDHLKVLGAVFGLFFFLQAYGYAKGARLPPPSSIAEAVTHGAAHLSHLLTPFSGVAWPFGPTVCGLLLLYALELPQQLARAQNSADSLVANRWFFSLVVAVSLTTTGGAIVVRSTWIVTLLNLRSSLPFALYIESLGYLTLVTLFVLLARWWLDPQFDRISVKLDSKGPGPRIAAAMTIAWLLLLAYTGSVFDGMLDFSAGVLGR